ncbi:hypothetical protein C1752_06127 [Acaryochloris thomasi RCC1774]|uniref:Tetratricopeptide repeat protein n=2 Tax=Acaryochloris TaxID=155977 RepID=A0A2W1JRS2_9CYAN|nr:hypothetical protein C1752_06127 [Acaryochloris thomasi RCC1774]
MNIRVATKAMSPILGLVILATPLQAQAQIPAVPAATTNFGQTGELAYDFHMRRGYAAVKQDDHVSAAIHFRNALYERPLDRDATTAYWNAQSALQDKADGSANDPPETDYDRYMEIGYDATESGDYQTALINFQRAQAERPNDGYAAQAIINTKTYIRRGEGADLEDLISLPNVYEGERPYDRYLRLGYAAAQRDDHQTAVTYFRSALYERPNDRQATIAYWNAVDVVKGGKQEQKSQGPEPIYDRYMRLGYDAAERKAYQKASRHFQKALEERPGDSYAEQALRNVMTYINAKTRE